MYEQSDHLNKEIEKNLKGTKILELKSTTEIKTKTLEMFNNRFSRHNKEPVNLKIGQLKLLSLRGWKKKGLSSEKYLTDLLDSSKQTNIHIMGVPEKEERGKKGRKNI